MCIYSCINILKGNEIEQRADSAASLLDLLPAGHEKRHDGSHDAEVCLNCFLSTRYRTSN